MQVNKCAKRPGSAVSLWVAVVVVAMISLLPSSLLERQRQHAVVTALQPAATTTTTRATTRFCFNSIQRPSVQLFSSSTDAASSTEITGLACNSPVTTTVNGKSVANGSSTTLNGSLQRLVEEASLHEESSIPGDASAETRAGGVVVLNHDDDDDDDDDDDVPMPTENGGYTHTTSSRAKISAANKGKTPWNKGQARSEETRARIAAGVRAKNRQRFLEKLQTMGLTEEEYDRQKREESLAKDAERRARKTEKGGYRPTAETKQKISTILKQKWARGEMTKQQQQPRQPGQQRQQPRSVDPDKVRRGFTHSQETRAKISASLKRLWAKDPEYRDNMVKKSLETNSKQNVKKRISESLKLKWQDPEFRALMLEKMKQKMNRPAAPHDLSHREKISQAMKKKWQDQEYRQKTLAAIQQRRKMAPPKTSIKKKPTTTISPTTEIRVVQPRKVQPPKKIVKRQTKKVANENDHLVVTSKKQIQTKKTLLVEPRGTEESVESTKERSSTTAAKIEPTSIQRLREERRDLYDLLYGEEEDASSGASDDESLDAFDPYGLDDF